LSDPRVDIVARGLLELKPQPASYDAVCSFYVFNHVPRERLGELVRRTARRLRPGGLFMHAFGVGDIPGWTGDWVLACR
jgi:2-polyprenyl-3-methyl-5-hydroxy-6-metoxy-1,4-benzoquinol methylase